MNNAVMHFYFCIFAFFLYTGNTRSRVFPSLSLPPHCPHRMRKRVITKNTKARIEVSGVQ